MMRNHTSDFKHHSSGLVVFQSFGQLLALVFLTSGLLSCKKEKLDYQYDDRPVTANKPNSMVRFINLAGYNQVIANGDSISSFVFIDPNAPGSIDIPPTPTSYFPETGQLGSSWMIPQDLFRADGTAKLRFEEKDYLQGVNQSLDLTIKDAYNNPMDYYALQTLQQEGQPAYVPVPRSVSPPSRPDYFKIRILNLVANPINYPSNASGAEENLVSTITLAYADGTPVDLKTTGLSVQQQVSDYIELPYGTYQFKVLTEDGRQYPAVGGTGLNENFVDPPTSTIPISYVEATNITYSPIRTYQPGGVYTIVVTPAIFNYYTTQTSETSALLQNAFKVIEDISAPLNTTYSRLQAVNALPGGGAGFLVNGQTWENELAFGRSSDYGQYVNGDYQITAIDQTGGVIASADITLRPSQNYTAWLYPAMDGSAQLSIVSNDLSGAVYVKQPGHQDDNDASFDRQEYDLFFNKRYLNLCPDIPYLSFTQGLGQAITGNFYSEEAVYNLQPGQSLAEFPYTWGYASENQYDVFAYRSFPHVTPGSWAEDIPILHSRDFIASKELYEQAGRTFPNQEPGVYTVALIGRSTPGTVAADRARMIIVKHNK